LHKVGKVQITQTQSSWTIPHDTVGWVLEKIIRAQRKKVENGRVEKKEGVTILKKVGLGEKQEGGCRVRGGGLLEYKNGLPMKL